MIKDGILQVGKIGQAKFEVDLIPESNKTSRPGYPLDFEYITVHGTENQSKGAGARMHTEYIDNSTAYVSWHFTVGDTLIFQELPTIECAWHAGDGRDGPGNRKSVSIEICENLDGSWNVAKYNAVKLIVLLLLIKGKPPGIVVPHKKWSGKYCPRKILNEGWAGFINLVEKEYAAAISHQNQVSSWARQAWDKAFIKGVNDGKDPKVQVTEEQLMVFFDRMGLLD